MPSIKWCFVPDCTNTLTRTPHKVFVAVPKDRKKRKRWFSAARRDVSEVSAKSNLYCCEDHFRLDEDMENYMEFRLTQCKKRMKTNVVPHLFACQLDREKIGKPRLFSERRAHKRRIEELVSSVGGDEQGEEKTLSYTTEESSKLLDKPQLITEVDAECQTTQKVSQDKSTQTMMDIQIMKHVATSPAK